MKKAIHKWVRKWKLFKWTFVADIRKEAYSISKNENLPKLVRVIYAKCSIIYINYERKLAKEYLLYVSESFQKTMKQIIRDSGL